ncbi:mitotic deacetylase-associated SANT domain protein isoform X1 [Micropterus dolomieu]|uniref:mitotic deacetylase-associated SANT domain protein isoform X1 n=1 Tax=Micropterus dolomieu TaxID=147949 RepID=UPI001E8D09EF|nr:mitotic deacetylase-associated SANT domain protein isoform X1 [Micropterus dolomieu]XP_045919382.1 mitotic deacetylase-associated SANT domain protein isoform X1 [Micropterus dolomieu]XP_045919383.1 mitotic deacetylase-associated SANT domain protein isoform X1 [Micropterus dolomieu]XP_045919384.1 mitotic deacetylase-associated SANT domain protein isoform X1 [Micropterus dolomieu]XP_045919385.1 mitotic deacetylase-associated SANT domain protein isoform X1 [Micropterus dolomieu]
MPVMSVPAQQKPSTKRTGKRITFFSEQGVAMKETPQHPEGSYYVPGGTATDPGQSEAASTVTSNPQGTHMYLNSVIFSPDKGDQSRGHYQQTVPMKWAHQEPSQQQPSLSQQQRAASWNTMTNWGQNINYIGGVNVTDSRTQNAFVKSIHETSGLQPHQQPPNRAADKQPLGPNSAVEAYRDAVHARGMDWEQQQPSQAFQETLKPGALNTQQHSTSLPGGSSVLQPFQLAFGQPKQHLPAYYQTFQGNRTTLPNPPMYSTQAPKPPQQYTIQRQQHILQQQIQQQHHQQMQQQQIIQHQHVQLQQQQQIQHEQQQQKLQQQQQQQLQIQQQMQHQQLQQQNPHVLDYYPAAQNAHPHPHPQPVVVHSQESSATAPPKIQEPIIQDITPEPQQPSEPLQPPLQSEPLSHTQTQLHSQTQLRRSRRLSKEGGAPSDNPFLSVASDQAAPGPQGSQNGAREIQAAPTGVIQSTRRKRRVSQEVNLETLAQKASEMESLPSHVVKEPHRPWSPTDSEGMNTKRHRDDSLLPLVIPVSVPVRRQEASSPDRDEGALASNWPSRPSNPQDLCHADHKPSVIVTRRRSLRNSLSESSEQNGGTEGEKDDDSKKSKRRPRPEPLFIPPPKPGLFIAPPVYSSITPYQSHLRSPVRLADNPLTMPPYTPPPILSPVREGSGLYFSTFLSSAAANTQGLPPPATPKSATRSLLRSNSCDITPPVLSAMSEATPVSIEPRINIGSRYQAEVPELRQRSAVELDHHRAEMVWAPLGELEEKPDFQEKVEDLMHLACSSVFCGGGTNQELAHHCLYECKGDIMAALSLLMLRNPIFPKSHHLANYHYSGSDSWTAVERRQFNKGITTYKKDFFMVQKQVTTKSVAQCVEFYYTYKKHVKIGRNGTLIYGEAEPLESRTTEEEMDNKQGSHRLEPQREEDSRKWEGSADRKQDVGPARVAHTLQSSDKPGTVLIMKGQEDVGRDQPPSRVIQPPPPPPPSSKTRYDSNARKTSPSTGNKGSAGQEGEFPCKKCGRIFYKVKSRSAHMKSHAEQEKKAAALRQKEAEERAAAKAAAEAAAVLAARQQNGTRQVAGDSTNEDSSDREDEDDEDWQ